MAGFEHRNPHNSTDLVELNKVVIETHTLLNPEAMSWFFILKYIKDLFRDGTKSFNIRIFLGPGLFVQSSGQGLKGKL